MLRVSSQSSDADQARTMSEPLPPTWLQWLNDNPLPWLLEPENPSVRYWVLTDLLDRSLDDAQVKDAQAAIAQDPTVKALLDAQHEQGHWGDDPAKPYTAAGTLGVLQILHMLAAAPDERTRAGCDSFLRYCQHESGGFALYRTQRSSITPCSTGQHLPMLLYFGLGDDPRVTGAFGYVIDSMLRDNPLDCGRYQHRPCLWGAIAALNGLAVLPASMVSAQSEQAVQALANALLDADYDFQGEHKRWLTFGVPRAWDLLSALKALAAHGYGADPRFTPLLDRLLAQQDAQGRWLCGSVSRTWPLEKRNRPSKWVTLDALRLLKSLG